MKKKSFLKCICINKNPHVRQLDFSSRYLRQVPQEIFNHERTLESLTLDNNNITELTKELFCCKALKELVLSDNELCHLPEAIDQLTHLNTLNISKNNLPDLPERIGNCSHLISLDASGNMFEQLPEALCRLTMLQELIVNTAFLNMLPQNIGRLVNLRHLDVRENEIKVLPHNIGSLSNLQYLDIGNNELTELPDSLCRLKNLSVLTADKNKIESLPEKIGACINLQVVELQQNCLTSLPDSITQCVFLTELVVSNNKLSAMPSTMGQWIRLKNLRIDNNVISSLPETVGQLDCLVHIYMSNNLVTHIPHSIGLLRRLRDLHADSNNIVDIPPEIGSCSSLTILSLRGNKIQYLPDEIGRIPHLKMLNLSNNRVKFLPISFLKLRELQAVWLNDNQIQPLVQLQSERDVDTGRKCLVCYLLPQMSNTEDPESMDNDPNAWQVVQDSRPRVVQWHDETTTETTPQSKSKLPKDAPAKQVNSKHILARQNKPAVTQPSQPILLSNGDCVMMNPSTLQQNQALQNSFINQSIWNTAPMYGPSSVGQLYCNNNGGMHRPGTRRVGSGYESDTAAMRSTRSWGRHGNQMMSPCQDGRLSQIHETVESGNHAYLSGGMSGLNMRQCVPPGGVMMAGNGGVGYGRHPAGGGMVGGRQSGYNTDTGLMMNSGRNGSRQVRHRPIQTKQTHYKNPFDQLRVLRSSDSTESRYDVPKTTNVASLPPPPSRQPPMPPQRPLPSPPFTKVNILPLTNDMDLSQTNNWHVQMVNHSVPDNNVVDSRTANMIIPPPPCRSPPNLASPTYPKVTNYLNQVPTNPMMVDLHHPGLSSISPSIIDESMARMDLHNFHPSTNVRTYYSTFSVIITRDKGLGFSITGGISSNPNLFRPDDKGIFIAKVNPAGPADGKLKVGDKILMVNNTSFLGIEHSMAVNVLKSCGDMVQMIIERLVDRDSDI